MNTIAIIGNKGGTGKTCTAYALSTILAQRGYKVLAVDADWQGSLSRLPNIYANKGALTLDDLLKSSNLTAAVPVSTTAGFQLISCSNHGDPYAEGIHDTALKEALARFEADYDWCIIDAPPTYPAWMKIILTAAQRAIIPVGRSCISYHASAFLSATIEKVRQTTNPELIISGILQNRVYANSHLNDMFREKLQETADKLNTKIFSTEIPEEGLVTNLGFEWNEVFSRFYGCETVRCYNALVNELLLSYETET